MFYAVVDPQLVEWLEQNNIKPVTIQTNSLNERLPLYKKFELEGIELPVHFTANHSYYTTNKLTF